MGCDFKCGRSNQFIIHKRIHMGEKPFECNFNGCEFSFKSSSELKEHKYTHSKMPEYLRKCVQW